MGKPNGGPSEGDDPSVDDPDFLDVDEVIGLHDQQLARYGGASGLRDPRALAAAVATPQASFGGEFLHADLFHMAAAYAFHIAENQPFVDGNKRTGLLAALVFLDLNGVTVVDRGSRLFDAMLISRLIDSTKQGSRQPCANSRHGDRCGASATF